MIRIKITQLLLLLSIFCFGQQAGNYIPLKFENLNPIWKHTLIDSSIIGLQVDSARDESLSFDGYSHLYNYGQFHLSPPLIKDGFLYHVITSMYDGDLSGGLIEKIDLETGEKIWQSVFDKRFSDYRETIEKAVIKEDTLILYNLRIIAPDPPIPFPVLAWGIGRDIRGVIKIRKYDLNTGNLLTTIDSDDTDPNVKILAPYGLGQRQMNIISDDSIEFIGYQFIDEKGPSLVLDTINSKGQILNDTDTIFSQIIVDDWDNSTQTFSYKFQRADDGTLYWLDYYSSNDNQIGDAALFIVMIEPELTKRISLEFLELEKYSSYLIQNISSEYILIKCFHKGTVTSPDIVDFVFLDKEGTIIRQIEDINNDEISPHFISIDENGEFTIGDAGGEVDGKYQFDIYRTKGENLHLARSLIATVPDYFVSPDKIIQLENGDYLLFIKHSERLENGNFLGRFHNILRVSPEMLGLPLISSTSSSFTNEVIFELYPNPTTDFLTIEIEEEILNKSYSFQLFDVTGIKKISQKLDSNHQQISVQNLSTGIYFYHLFENQKPLATGKLIIER